MKKNNILLYIFSFFAIFFIFQKNTYAITNTNTTYTIDYQYNSDLDLPLDNNFTFTSFFESLNNINSPYYNLTILFSYFTNNTTNRPAWIGLVLVPKSQTSIPYYVYGQSGVPNYFEMGYYGTSFKFYSLSVLTKPNDITQLQKYIDFINCYTNNSCSNYTDRGEYRTSYNCGEREQPVFQDFNNSSSYNVYLKTLNESHDYGTSILGCYTDDYIFYSSQTPLMLSNYRYTNNQVTLYKDLIFNNQEYTFGDIIPSYHDLMVHTQITDSFSKQFDTQLNTLYAKVPTSNVSNININFSFNPSFITPQEYLQNLSWGFNTLVYGRVNHNNEYYSFEKLECDFTNIDNPTDEFTNSFTFSGLTCNNVNLSNYDYIYFTLLTNYANWDSTLQKDIYGINLTTNYGNVMYRQYAGVIYELLEDLPSGFNLFFSSKACDTCLVDLRLYSSTNTIWYSAYDITNLSLLNISNGNVQPLTSIINIDNPITELKLNSVYNLTKNYGYMIYNDSTNNNTPSTDLYIFIDENVMYSVKSNGAYHYYLPNTNTIDSSDITIDYDSNYQDYSNSFDLSALVNSITDFIDDIISEINEFSNFLQYCYNLLPIYCKSIIIVLFNILLVKSIIKLIKGDFDDE